LILHKIVKVDFFYWQIPLFIDHLSVHTFPINPYDLKYQQYFLIKYFENLSLIIDFLKLKKIEEDIEENSEEDIEENSEEDIEENREEDREENSEENMEENLKEDKKKILKENREEIKKENLKEEKFLISIAN